MDRRKQKKYETAKQLLRGMRQDAVKLVLKGKLDSVGLGNCTPSSFEIDIASILLDHGLDFDYNSKLVHSSTTGMQNTMAKDIPSIGYQKISLSGANCDREEIFRPDFIINDIQVHNKTLVLEPHGKRYFDYRRINKYKNFMNFFGDSYYFVIITDHSKAALANMLCDSGMRISDICDELLHVNKHSELLQVKSMLRKLEQQNERKSAAQPNPYAPCKLVVA
ncbi:MAG: hypothetical protein M1331_00785 [Candidatus Marsarchaeota archaeon]|nr:hypothetical protein [Candidatus Marsarchaeota archaeon]